MSDIRTVIEKEWREQYRRGSKFTGQFWLTVTVFPLLALGAGVAGIVIAYVLAKDGLPVELTSMIPPFAAIAVMQLLGTVSMQMGLDTIAGERERHTLDTLLSTPISTRDLFLGKLLLPTLIAFAIGQTIVVLLGLVTTVLFGWWALLWMVAAMAGILFTLVPNMIGGVAFAMIFSARSESIKAAQQKMGLAMIPFYVIFMIFIMSTSSGGINLEVLPPKVLIGLGIGIFAFLWGSAVLFVILAYRGFKRERLVLA